MMVGRIVMCLCHQLLFVNYAPPFTKLQQPVDVQCSFTVALELVSFSFFLDSFNVIIFTGRTGTFAAIEMAYRDLIANDREVQMSTIFQRLRDQRALAIQTDLQVS